MFWIIAFALVVLVLLPILSAIRGGRHSVSDRADLAVYRDQRVEVERDLARGTLTPGEAERTRIEVQRRLLDADRDNPGTGRMASGAARLALAAGLLVTVLFGGVGLDAMAGAPGYRDLPISLRIELSEQARATQSGPSEAGEFDADRLLPPELEPDFARLMTRLRQTPEQRPDDVAGFRSLARNEVAAGNIRAARAAQARLVDLQGDDATADDLATLAELMVHAADGLVTGDAETIRDRALGMAPRDGRAMHLKALSLARIDAAAENAGLDG